MKRTIMLSVLIVMLSSVAGAVPVKTAEYGQVTPRSFSPAQDQCVLMYHNFCSHWVYYWSGGWPDAKVGVCFDLNDCDCSQASDLCRALGVGYWGMRRMSVWGWADFDIYCADVNCCPCGPPLASARAVPIMSLWTGVNWSGVNLNSCEPGCVPSRFISMCTVTSPNDNAPYHDADNLNWDRGCGDTWTCIPHSYVYLAYDTDDDVWIDYCAETGYPGNMFYADSRSYCQTQFGVGFYHNWLVYMYIDCTGASATEGHSWSEIKALYK